MTYLATCAFSRNIQKMNSFLTTPFTFSESLQVLKSLLMRGRVESGVLDEGDSAGVPQESFENHFRGIFLNVRHI